MRKKRVHRGQLIRRFRQSLGLKQDAVAMAMNLKQQTISKYENQANIDDKTFEQFANAMGADAKTVMSLIFLIDNLDTKNSETDEEEKYRESVSHQTIDSERLLSEIKDSLEKIEIFSDAILIGEGYKMKTLGNIIETLLEINDKLIDNLKSTLVSDR